MQPEKGSCQNVSQADQNVTLKHKIRQLDRSLKETIIKQGNRQILLDYVKQNNKKKVLYEQVQKGKEDDHIFLRDQHNYQLKIMPHNDDVRIDLKIKHIDSQSRFYQGLVTRQILKQQFQHQFQSSEEFLQVFRKDGDYELIENEEKLKIKLKQKELELNLVNVSLDSQEILYLLSLSQMTEENQKYKEIIENIKEQINSHTIRRFRIGESPTAIQEQATEAKTTSESDIYKESNVSTIFAFILFILIVLMAFLTVQFTEQANRYSRMQKEHFFFKKSQLQTQKANIMNIFSVEKPIQQNSQSQLRTEEKIVESEKASAYSYVDTPYLNNFQADQNIIKYKSENIRNQILINRVIPEEQVFKIRFQIKSTKESNIMIGIVNLGQQRNEFNSFSSGNSVCYCGNGGIYYRNNVGKSQFLQGKGGFRQGQIVHMQVNLADKTIRWTVNGNDKGLISLQDTQNIQYVPYLQMYNRDDEVSWIIY